MPNDNAVPVASISDIIDVYEPNELRRWAEHFGVSQERLQITVAVVGVSVEAVRKYFGKSCQIRMD
ncbi:MAG: DUF3606 domain-containing protein [Rhodocyclaceae bacterium]|nr:DUF3606 domain-containing protein [Rhodocyclaceae bacterium]